MNTIAKLCQKHDLGFLPSFIQYKAVCTFKNTNVYAIVTTTKLFTRTKFHFKLLAWPSSGRRSESNPAKKRWNLDNIWWVNSTGSQRVKHSGARSRSDGMWHRFSTEMTAVQIPGDLYTLHTNQIFNPQISDFQAEFSASPCYDEHCDEFRHPISNKMTPSTWHDDWLQVSDKNGHQSCTPGPKFGKIPEIVFLKTSKKRHF